MESLLCSLLKSRRIQDLIEELEIMGDRVRVVIRIPPGYRRLLRCLEEVGGNA